MQFSVKLAGPAPDTAAIRQVLCEADPSSMVDMNPDGQSLRIACSMPSEQLATLIRQAGYPLVSGDMQQLPSECCGGCGG